MVMHEFLFNSITDSLKSKLLLFIIRRQTLRVPMKKSNNFSSTDLRSPCTPRLHARDPKEIIYPFLDYYLLFKVMLMKRLSISLSGKTILEIWTKAAMVQIGFLNLPISLKSCSLTVNCLLGFLAVHPTILFILSFLIVFKDYYFSNEPKIPQFLFSSSLIHDITQHKTSVTKSKPQTSSRSIEFSL